jgi:hypothetical protein
MASSTIGSPVNERFERLNVAAALRGFDQALVRSAKVSIGWGLFAMIIGAIFFATGRFGWINLICGLALVIEGIYEMKVREPKVIIVAATTLGFLAIWNMGSLVAAAFLHARLGGHPIAGILQALGAWATYGSYSVYAALLAKSDPGAKQELESLIQQIETVDPGLAHDVAQFEVKKFSDPLQVWRIKNFDGLLLFVKSEEVLGVKKFATECFLAQKQNVRLEILGEKMFGEKQNAVIYAGVHELKNVVITPGIARKLQSFLL